MEYHILINLKNKKGNSLRQSHRLKIRKEFDLERTKVNQTKTQFGLIVATYVALLIIAQLTGFVIVKKIKMVTVLVHSYQTL